MKKNIKRFAKLVLCLAMLVCTIIPNTKVYAVNSVNDSQMSSTKMDYITMGNIVFYGINEIKSYSSLMQRYVGNDNGKTFKEVITDLPTPYLYDDLEFRGWFDEDGNEYDENTVIDQSQVYKYYAKYNYKVAEVVVGHIAISQGIEFVNKTSSKLYLFKDVETYGDVVENITSNDNFLKGTYFEVKTEGLKGWKLAENKGYNENTLLNDQVNKMQINADYGTKTILRYEIEFPQKNESAGANSGILYVDKGTTYDELNDYLNKINFNDNLKNLYTEGLKGWSVRYTDSTSSIVSDYDTVCLVPMYEQGRAVTLNFKYVTKDKQIKDVTKLVFLKDGSTYTDLKNYVLNLNMENSLDDMDLTYFDQWATSGVNYVPNTLPYYHSYYGVSAEYKDKKVVNTSYRYINTEGREVRNNIVEYVDTGTTYEQLRAKMISTSQPEDVNKDLVFKEWVSNGWQSGEILFDFNGSIVATATYENNYVHYIVHDINDSSYKISTQLGCGGEHENDEVKLLIAKIGDTITVPSFDMFKNIKWLDGISDEYTTPGNTFVLESNMTIYGGGEYIVEQQKPEDDKKDPEVEKPVVTPEDDEQKDQEVEKPNNKPTVEQDQIIVKPENGQGSIVVVDESQLQSEQIQQIVSEINNASQNQVIEVDMGNSVYVPVEVLSSLKGKDVTVLLNMQGYSWKINGKDIIADNLKEINLEVVLNTNEIPNNFIENVSNGNTVKQLTLLYSGEFGFTATLSYNIGKEYAGKTVDLYYYNPEGKMEFQNSAIVDESGNVGLKFSHASDYALVIKDQTSNNQNMLPLTGDNTSIILYAGLCSLALIVAIFTFKTKRN